MENKKEFYGIGPAEYFHNSLKENKEPINPDNFFILVSPASKAGVTGHAKFKVWYEGSKQIRKEIGFTPVGKGG